LISGNHKSIPHDLKREGVLWGRRSLFFLNRKPLCVAEFYLPAFVEHLNRG
jgi:chorismate-pyruvate lyase